MTRPGNPGASRTQASALLSGRSPWLAVTGAKGGVGKTLISVNLAIQIARSGHRVLLVDLDPGLGNVDVHLRLCPSRTIEDVVDGRCEAGEALLAGPEGLSILCGRSGSTALTTGGAFAGRVLEKVDEIGAPFDLVIADTGAGIGPSVLAVARRADSILAVTTPDPSSLTDTYALCKLLHHRDGRIPRLVVNLVRSRDEAMRTAGKLATVCRKFLHADCPLAGWLTRDTLVELSVAEQRPFALHGLGAAMEDIRALCASALSSLPPLGRRVYGSRREAERPLRPKSR
ncbi:MAG: hypothetical protein Fur0037_14070 [Planctomycetota bacterium]